MRRISMTFAAVSALAATSPLAAAQPWNGARSHSAQLQLRFDAGIESGAISRREAMPLRAQLRQLVALERQYSRAGLNRWERNSLRRHSQSLSMDMAAAERSDGGRFARGDNGRGGEAFDDGRRNGRDDGIRGDARSTDRDRFAGDLRVGQPYSPRHAPLPAAYRDRYRDSESAYFGYDNHRVYQIDRVTGIILAMFDVGR